MYTGFLILGTVNGWGKLIICCGDSALCIVECCAVSLASTNEVPPPCVTTKNASPTLVNIPLGAKSPRWRTTDVDLN